MICLQKQKESVSVAITSLVLSLKLFFLKMWITNEKIEPY